MRDLAVSHPSCQVSVTEARVNAAVINTIQEEAYQAKHAFNN